VSAAYWQYALWHCLQYRKYVCLHALYNPIIQTSTVQGHPRSKIMASICSTRVVSCSSFIGTVIVSVITFAIFDVQFWWPWSMPVQGHPWSKYIGPVESPLMVSYLTAFESNIVSVFMFEIFDEKVLWTRSRTVQGHPRSKVMLSVYHSDVCIGETGGDVCQAVVL